MGTPPEPSDVEIPPEADDSPGGEVSIQRIQVINLGILAVASIASFWVSTAFVLGVVSGGVLMAANFRVLVGVIRAVFLKGSSSIAHVGIYWVKFVGVMVLVGVIVVTLRVDPIGFLVGLSTILVAVTTEAALRLAGK